MSALPPKADIACGQLDVRFVPEADIAALFVVADAATLITDACHIGFLWNGLARSGLREVVVLYNNATFRCGFSGVVLSLPKRVALEFQSTNVDPHHGLICIRRQFSVRHVKAEDIQVAVVELFVVLVVELAQRRGLVGLDRGNGAVEHGLCFLRCAGLLGRSQTGATEQYRCSERRRKQVSTHGFSLWQTALKGAALHPTPALPPKADIHRRCLDVRFVPIADIRRLYSMTSSASCRKCTGKSKPNALVVLRLIINGTLIGIWIG